MPNARPDTPAPATPEPPLSRQDRKDLTRQSLVQAALRLIGEGRSFTSLGIREIAREAGMVLFHACVAPLFAGLGKPMPYEPILATVHTLL